MLPTIEWQDDAVVMIDQRKLPASEVYVTCRTGKDVAKAITTMVIRGAPAIGVCAAMGLALGAQRSKATGTKQFTTEFQRNCDQLAATRRKAIERLEADLGNRLTVGFEQVGRQAQAGRNIGNGQHRHARCYLMST